MSYNGKKGWWYEMKYRLLVTDIDDTLLTSDKRITDKVLGAVAKAQDAGVTVAIASGRLPAGVRPYVDALHIRERGGYYLAFNGGLIMDAHDSILHADVLDRKYLAMVCRALEPFNVAVLVHRHDRIYTDNNQNSYAYTEPEALGLPLNRLDSLTRDVDWDLHKILIAGEPEILKEAEPALKAQFGGELDIFLSAPWFLDVMPKGVTKGAGIRYIADKMGIGMDEVIACGDSCNDISMIKAAGMGVAMHNGEEELKTAADYVTQNGCDSDGVAEVIEKFILS